MSFEPLDYLRHINDYFGVDYELVWDVVQNRIPTLHSQIDSILAV